MAGRPAERLTALRARMTINALTVPALKLIKEAINGGDVITARWAVEMHLGKPKQQMDIAAEVAGQVKVELEGLATEELHALLQMLRERPPGQGTQASQQER